MKIYLVGGAVRNNFLKLPIKDRDWMIVGADPKQLLGQGFLQVGQNFPVFLHPETKEEYALARTERKSGPGYKGFMFDFNPNITLEEDLIRRDLTINAIAQDEMGEIYDPFHGIYDIEHKILRHISSAFREDPLRVLRVARFAAEFHDLGFSIAPETLELMQIISLSDELQALTMERVWIETEKALNTKHPEIYFLTLRQCNALNILFPELDCLFEIESPSSDLNLAEFTFEALQKIVIQSSDLPLRFSVLTQNIGFNESDSNILSSFLNRLKIPIHYQKKAIRYHFLFWTLYLTPNLSSKFLLNLLYALNVWKEPNNLVELSEISVASTPKKEAIFMKERIKILNKAFNLTKNIDAQMMMMQGFSGKSISEQLFIARLEQLHFIHDQ